MWTYVHLLRYLLELYRELPGSWKEKKILLSRMANSIRDYVSEGEYVSYARIVARFGEPKEISADYISQMETQEVIKAITNKKKKRGILICIVAVVFLWMGYVTYCYYDLMDSWHGTMVIEGPYIIEKTEYENGGP